MKVTCNKCADKKPEDKKECPYCKGKGYIVLSQGFNVQKL